MDSFMALMLMAIGVQTVIIILLGYRIVTLLEDMRSGGIIKEKTIIRPFMPQDDIKQEKIVKFTNPYDQAWEGDSPEPRVSTLGG